MNRNRNAKSSNRLKWLHKKEKSFSITSRAWALQQCIEPNEERRKKNICYLLKNFCFRRCRHCRRHCRRRRRRSFVIVILGIIVEVRCCSFSWAERNGLDGRRASRPLLNLEHPAAGSESKRFDGELIAAWRTEALCGMIHAPTSPGVPSVNTT